MSESKRAMYQARRAELLERIGPGVVVIPAAPVSIRNHDVEHDYRQSSDFYYLTGFEEPDSVLVLSNLHASDRFVLFVRPRDPERETWDGARAGLEGAVRDFGADAAFATEQLREKLPDYLLNTTRMHHRFGTHEAFDGQLLTILLDCRKRARRGDRAPQEWVDLEPTLHEQRMRKRPEEVQHLQQAASITAEAHLAAMRIARPGVCEYEVEAALLEAFHRLGAKRPAYGSIVGSGPNATILHYRSNRRQMQDGDLLLVDAGAEYEYYAADVTRTFPVSGRFSEEQRVIYEIVLHAQHEAISVVRPGVTLDDVHQAALRVIVEGLRKVGLLSGTTDDILQDKSYQAFFMHRTSHWLGMDVHDVGAYYVDRKPRRLEEGFVLTVEPGIYISESAPVDARWKNIGVRIEDDVLVTKSGCDVLTLEIPKEVSDLEEILAGGR